MKWAVMTWTEKANAVTRIFGSTCSDCGADELLYLWDAIRERNLEYTYLNELAGMFGILRTDSLYTPCEILQMMTASDEQYHWPAALRAVGVEVQL